MKTVFVLGSLNMDLVMKTNVFPRPGETVHGEHFFTNPGGKGANQAVAVARQGVPVVMLGAVGQDAYGEVLTSHLHDLGVDTSHVQRVKGSSGVAVILLHHHENRILLQRGANDGLQMAPIQAYLQAQAKPGDYLLMQFEIPLAMVESMIPFAASLGLKIILNPAPAYAHFPKTLFASLDLLIPNEGEAANLCGLPPETTKPETSARLLYEHGVKNVVITLGEEGCLHYNGENTYFPAMKVRPVDTTAAGDAFVGALAAELAKDVPLVEAIQWANRVAAVTVTKMGAQDSIPTRQEVEDFFPY